MARIVGGIAASHTPTIGFAFDRDKRDDPAWTPVFEQFAPLARWLEEKHQVHGERAGFNNPDWDARFMDLFERDPARLADMTLAEYATLGGFEGAEVVMWLTMRGALPAQVTKVAWDKDGGAKR